MKVLDKKSIKLAITPDSGWKYQEFYDSPFTSTPNGLHAGKEVAVQKANTSSSPATGTTLIQTPNSAAFLLNRWTGQEDLSHSYTSPSSTHTTLSSTASRTTHSITRGLDRPPHITTTMRDATPEEISKNKTAVPKQTTNTRPRPRITLPSMILVDTQPFPSSSRSSLETTINNTSAPSSPVWPVVGRASSELEHDNCLFPDHPLPNSER